MVFPDFPRILDISGVIRKSLNSYNLENKSIEMSENSDKLENFEAIGITLYHEGRWLS